MAANDFKAFAAAIGANVMSQADYAAAAFLLEGFQPGIAISAQLNKVWRQATFMSAVVAQFAANETGVDVLDDGDLDSKVALIAAAVQIAAGARPTRIVAVSTPLAITGADSLVGLARVAAPAPTAISLPLVATGRSFTVEDLVGNLNAFPATITPPAGHNIAGLANWLMNIDRKSYTFSFYGSNTWSVSS